MQVVILAGGLGTRLGPLGVQRPKALAPVAGRPFLAYVIELLKSRGLTRLLLLIGHHGQLIEQEFGDGSSMGVEISYQSDGEKLLGTGGALRNALSRLEEEFLVLYGDTYLDIDYQAVIRAFRTAGKSGLMTVYKNSGRLDTSNVVFKDGHLIRYSKQQRTVEMDYIDYGLAALQRGVIERVPEGKTVDLAALYEELVATGEMIGFEVHQRFYEIGTPGSLREFEEHLKGAGSEQSP